MNKILVVEDNRESRCLLERLLASRGHQIMAAENGEEALRLAREDPPEVIISDIMMPVMNGFKLCSEVKKDTGLRHTPFIFYAATFVDESDRKLAMGLGASRFLVKPTEGDQFIQILDEVMKEQRDGILPVPEGPLEDQDVLLEMYENSITRKLAETVEKLQDERSALLQSERRLKEAQELAHIGHWELDLKTDSLEWSDEIYRILGVKPQEFDPSYKSLMAMEVIHPDDRADVAKVHKESLSEKTPSDIEYRLLLKDGTVKYVNEKFQTLYDDEGMPTCSMGTVQDITERKRAEGALNKSEERYRAMFDNIMNGVAIYRAENNGEDFVFIEFNKSAEKMEHIEKEDLIGKSVLEIFPSVKDFGLFDVFQRVWKTGKPESHSVAHYRDERIEGWRENFVYKLPSGEIVSVYSDETERKQAEEALRDAEFLYRLHFENVSDVIYSVDRELKLINISPSVERVLGYKPEELIGRPIQELNLLAPESLEQAASDAMCVLGGERITSTEYQFIARDGTRRWGEVSGAPLIRDGQVAAVISVARDITERKKAEEERERLQDQFNQAQKMESVGRLAGGVAHDFNNMLSVIQGRTDLALFDVDPKDPLHASLQEISKAAKRSSNVIRQLLAFARKQTIAPEVLNLNDTVEGMLKMLRRLIGEDIDLTWQPDTNLWPVKMDSAQIDQILANLCVNARDAISGVGKVAIETANVTLDEAYCEEHAECVPGEYVMLGVSDNGIGMDRETMENVFEPFFTTKEVGKGTGLGLATVYGIVKQNQGFINVASELGKGTTFRIYLPRHRGETEEEMEAAKAEIPRGHGETILIVEDEVPVLDVGKQILERMGYTVLATGSPGEAMTTARQYSGEIDLLMTDVVLPQMSGKDLAEEMTRIRPKTRIIFMSGYTADIIAHRGILDKGVHFIQKPFTPDSLARKVREVLDKA